jgi:hypothetical protein
LHAPTVTDPSLAPEGCEAFYVLAPVPHLGKSKVDWVTEGPRFADKIISYLENNGLPDLKKHIITQRTFTPIDFKNELGAHWGSAFSLEPLLTQSAYFRISNRDPRIQGLYFVGAGTHPGAGVPGVVNSAKATSSVILKDFPLEQPAPVAQCQEMIRKGSKSFSLAARFFKKEEREAAVLLYGWCRYCDDEIDALGSLDEKKEKLANLKYWTSLSFDRSSKIELPLVFLALRSVVLKYNIPKQYALDILDGMETDLLENVLQAP